MEMDIARQRVEVARQLLDMLKVERMAYLVINVVVAAILIGFGIYAAVESNFDLVVVGAFFGSAGMVTYTTGRVLRIWSQVFESVMGAGPGAPAADAPRPS